MNYFVKGNRKKPAILFLHGFMGCGLDWEKVIEDIYNDYLCFAPDLPGHGKTLTLADDDSYTMPATAEAVIQLLRDHQVNKAYLAGYSLGGRLAFYLVVRYPEFWNRVLLESASPGLESSVERLKRLRNDLQLAKKLQNGDLHSFLTDWYNQDLFHSLRLKINFSQLFQQRLKNNKYELSRSLRMMSTGRQPSLWSHLPNVQVDILLLVGEEDSKYKNIAAEVASRCPRAEIRIIKNSGHNIHFENK